MKSSIQLKTTKVFEHLDSSDKRIIVEQGGTRSGKTYNILIWIIFKYCMINTKKIITICRKHGPSLRGSSMRDFFDLLQTHNLYTETAHSKSLNEYGFKDVTVKFLNYGENKRLLNYIAHTEGPIFIIESISNSKVSPPCMEVLSVTPYLRT